MSLWKERFGVAPADPVVAFTESLSFDLRLSRHFALSPELFAQLSGCTDAVLAVPIPTIEKLGGGSVRCMLAEVFRPA